MCRFSLVLVDASTERELGTLSKEHDPTQITGMSILVWLPHSARLSFPR